MLTDELTAERREIPHEPGQWMMLRRLAWTELDSAAKGHEREAMGGLMDLPGDILTEALKGAITTTSGPTRKQYSKQLVLRFGIVAWSYTETLAGEEKGGLIDRLDPVTAEWAYQEILGLSGVRDTEGDRKNGSSGSTAGSTELASPS